MFKAFTEFLEAECIHETVYEDSEGRTILVIGLLNAFAMANKWGLRNVKAERDALKAAAEKGTEYVLAQINQGLKAERDALLVALQEIVEDQEEFRICCGESMWREHDDKCWVPKAKAAINAIRGDK